MLRSNITAIEVNLSSGGKGSNAVKPDCIKQSAYLLQLPQLKCIRALNVLLLMLVLLRLLLRLMMQLLLLRMALHCKGKQLRGQMVHLRRRSELRQWRRHGTSAFCTCDVLPAGCDGGTRAMLLLLRC